jgi:hypothetical protein
MAALFSGTFVVAALVVGLPLRSEDTISLKHRGLVGTFGIGMWAGETVGD